jgi:hypothetical protein
MNDPNRLDPIVVEISRNEESGSGTGFYISEDLVVTCYHVLVPDTGSLRDQYWVRHDTWDGWAPAEPLAEHCFPPPRDTAVLRCSRRLQQESIVRSANWDKSSTGFFSKGYDQARTYGLGARTINGEIRGSTVLEKRPRLQLRTTKGTIVPGRSGSPVWVRQQEAIVGVLDWLGEGLEADPYELALAIPIADAIPESRYLQDEFPVVRAYIEEVAAQKPYAIWNDQTFIGRTVADAGDLFSRTVAPFNARAPEREIKAEDLDKALRTETKVVLLGEPGAGKTTSLLHLGWEIANRHLNDPNDHEIPIYVELKYYNGETEIELLLARRINEILRTRRMELASDLIESTVILKAWLARSDFRFLLLLDGLNEVDPRFHNAVRAALQTLLNSPNRIVISCREIDYDYSLSDRASAFVLQGLQEKDIQDYLRRALRAEGVDIFRRIQSDKGMMTVASNPLMLWIIGEVAKSDPKAQLPTNHGRLFQQFTAYMPRLRAKEGIRQNVSTGLVTETLAKLAFELKEHGRLVAELGEARGWEIPTSGQALEGVLVQAKDWRFLVSDGQRDPVAFLHPLFLEYFAATYLESQVRDHGMETALRERALSGIWDEVIVMLAGLHEDPGELANWLTKLAIEQRQKRPALLAYQCWATTGAAKKTYTRAPLQNALIDALKDADGNVRRRAAEALGDFNSPSAVKALIAALTDPDETVRVKAASALGDLHMDLKTSTAKTHISVIVKALISVLHDPDTDVRSTAVWALGSIGDPSAFRPLVTVLQDRDADVRAEAAWALMLVGESKAIEPLSAALKDKDASVRLSAAGALGQTFDRRAIKPLGIALRDKDAAVRKEALEALAASGDPNPQVAKLLVSALRDTDADVRWSAAEALGNIGDRRALAELERLILEDKEKTSYVLFTVGKDKDEPSWGGAVADAARTAADKIRQGNKV